MNHKTLKTLIDSLEPLMNKRMPGYDWHYYNHGCNFISFAGDTNVVYEIRFKGNFTWSWNKNEYIPLIDDNINKILPPLKRLIILRSQAVINEFKKYSAPLYLRDTNTNQLQVDHEIVLRDNGTIKYEFS